jgi:hypothetical protein
MKLCTSGPYMMHVQSDRLHGASQLGVGGPQITITTANDWFSWA